MRLPGRRLDVASIPEVCGDAAVYFDPLDPESIAEGSAPSSTTAVRRIERAARFTWERAPAATTRSTRSSPATV